MYDIWHDPNYYKIMPNAIYDKNKIISLYEKGNTYDEVAKEIGCSRATVAHYCDVRTPNAKCVICSKEIYVRPHRINGYNCCSISCRNKWFSKDKHPKWKGGKRTRNRLNEKKALYLRKLKLINLLGGKCSKCGYDNCIAGLDFHHVDPNTKDATLKDLIRCDFKKALEEVKKCILLCAVCHREQHWLENNEELLEWTKTLRVS